MEKDLVSAAVQSVISSEMSYCKFLSANDSGETGGHQSGILISKSALNMLFTRDEISRNHILKRMVKIRWQDDFTTDGCFTWYESKNELRLTRLGKGFPLLRPMYTGALFVFIRNTLDDFNGYIFNEEDDIQQFLDAVGISPTETNRPIENGKILPEVREKSVIDDFINGLDVEFPTSDVMSTEARLIYYAVWGNRNLIRTDPDHLLVEWTREEYTLFRSVEHARYGKRIKDGFDTVDDFVAVANMVLNRRKSRAGKSLEHHLANIFDANEIRYTPQAVTEENKRPDFLFPSEEDYHNPGFAVEKLCTLAAKTTCKDRWRQVLNEANRLRDHTKYLCTLQQGISSAQLHEMKAEKVRLVVPKEYHSMYPREYRGDIWTIQNFIGYIQEIEKN